MRPCFMMPHTVFVSDFLHGCFGRRKKHLSENSSNFTENLRETRSPTSHFGAHISFSADD